MGKNNSSLTRVRPVFDALYNLDKTGNSWLQPLLNLGTRSIDILNNEASLPLTEAPFFELSVHPPKLFLRWLLDNPNELTHPPDRYWSKLGETTRQKRRALLENDISVQNEAVTALDTCLKLPDRVWWRLEGVTKVDCMLKISSAVIFIEGKRTEMGASKKILWYPYRNQVLRNLDCASEYAKSHGIKDYFVMTIVEKDLVEKDCSRQEELQNIVNPKTIEMSLPHLTKKERSKLMEHYLGVTTWQDIVKQFGLDWVCL